MRILYLLLIYPHLGSLPSDINVGNPSQATVTIVDDDGKFYSYTYIVESIQVLVMYSIYVIRMCRIHVLLIN